MKKVFFAAALLFGFALLASVAHTASAEFFKGKSIRLVIGNSVGGAMDDSGSLCGVVLGKHIPGNPDIVVQNMPGAGAIIAANHIYSVAKPDGLTIGVVNPANYIDQLLGIEGSQIRLAEIFLDRFPGTNRSGFVYPYGFPL